jgi:1-acyl-sn-glycerol-3-phosphate acyltransferase
MKDMIIRAIKGQCMAAMFGGFFLGMLVILILVLPANWFLTRFFGRDNRVEAAARCGFGWWLRTMGIMRLIRAMPTKGKAFEGPCVVVCNHPGLFDVLFLIRGISNLSVMVKTSLVRFLPLGPILRSLGYVLVPDYDRINPLDTAEAAIRQIRLGRKLQLFPEGTRSPAGGIRSFRMGAFKLARWCGVPIQPVLIRNHPPFMPKEARWYYPPREVSILRMEFWEPMPPPAKGEERAYARELEGRYRQALGLEPSGSWGENHGS